MKNSNAGSLLCITLDLLYCFGQLGMLWYSIDWLQESSHHNLEKLFCKWKANVTIVYLLWIIFSILAMWADRGYVRKGKLRPSWATPITDSSPFLTTTTGPPELIFTLNSRLTLSLALFRGFRQRIESWWTLQFFDCIASALNVAAFITCWPVSFWN